MTPLSRPRAYAAALAGCLAVLVSLPLAGAVSGGMPAAVALDGANQAALSPHATATTTSTSTTTATATGIGTATGTIDISAVPADQGVVRAGAPLSLSVVVTNEAGVAIPAGTATVYLAPTAVNRAELAAWLTPPVTADSKDARLGRSVLEVPTPPLVAGQSAALDGTVIPAAALGLVEPVTVGARQLSVVVAAGAEDIGSVRTAITVAPAGSTRVASLAVAAPLDVPATGSGLIPGDLLESFTSPTGVLTRQLDQAFGRPVALGIDPRVIASIRALGDSAPPSATLWLQRLAGAPNETFPLAYADSDIAATSQAGAGVLVPTFIDLDAAAFPAGPTPTTSESATPAPSSSLSPGVDPSVDPEAPIDPRPTLEELLAWDYSVTGIAWPADDSVVTADLDTFALAGLTTTILSSSNAGLGFAGSGSGAVVDEHRIAVSDDAISTLLRDAVTAPTLSLWQSAIAELTASLAALAGEEGAASSALATLDRSVPAGDNRLADTVAAIEALPWVQSTGLGTALRAEAPVTTLVEAPVAAERLAQFTSLLDSEAATAQFATVLDSSELITGERRLSLLAATSVTWVDESDAWATVVDAYRMRSSEILTSVQIAESSDLLLPSQNGDLPITISNALPYPVTVYVTVLPQKPILNVLDSNVEVTIEAGSQKRAPVPVQSVANGDVTIAVSLASGAGVPISQPVFTTISVQAQWETAAVSVLAALIVGVFAFGIIRTARRRLRARRGSGDAPAQVTAESDG